jgi:ribosome-interacting GTPase 1
MQLRKLFNSRPVIKTNYLLLNKYNNCVIKFKDSELDELIDFVENFKEYEESDETVCVLGNIRNVDILHDYVLIKKELGYYTILLEEIKNLENLKTVLYDTKSIVQH